MKKEENSLTFEASLKELEKIVTELEKGDGSLESQLKAFEKGVGLSRDCVKKLEEVEKRVELLTRNSQKELQTNPWPENS